MNKMFPSIKLADASDVSSVYSDPIIWPPRQNRTGPIQRKSILEYFTLDVQNNVKVHYLPGSIQCLTS